MLTAFMNNVWFHRLIILALIGLGVMLMQRYSDEMMHRFRRGRVA